MKFFQNPEKFGQVKFSRPLANLTRYSGQTQTKYNRIIDITNQEFGIGDFAEEYYICEGCVQVFWVGGHHERTLQRAEIAQVLNLHPQN